MIQKYSSYVLCFSISLLVVALYVNSFTPLVRLEWKIQDLMYSFRGEDNHSSDILLISIDDQTLNEFGEWPWHRDEIADLLAAVGSGEPKTILLDILFDPSVDEDTSGYTEILAGQMSWMKNVVVPYELSRAEFMCHKVSNPRHLHNFSMQVNSDLGILSEQSTLLARKIFLPPEAICQYAAGLGFKHNVFDQDRKVRWEQLVMHYEGYYYPSAALVTAACYMGLPPSTIKVFGSECIKMGNIEIPTNTKGQLLINYNKPNRSFTEISATNILNERHNLIKLKNKLAIISVTAKGLTDAYRTPVSPKLSSVEKTANIIENIIHSNFIRRLDSSPGRDTLLLLLLGSVFAFILPRVSLMYRLVILLACFFILANLNFVLFNSLNVLTHSLYFGLELFLLLLASPFLDKEFLSKFSFIQIGFKTAPETTILPKVKLPDMVTVTRKSGGMKPPQERIETAIIPREDLPSHDNPEEPVADAPKGDAGKPVREQSEMPVAGEEKREEIEYPQPVDQRAAFPATLTADGQVSQEQSWATDTPRQLGGDGRAIKSFGRYRILGILGKGAMGKVYKGIDPAINRNVALKTIRLDFVDDPEELAELKERLFREARAAGMLSHPNIVTIYDVGTEGDLQYIAMEYLEGQTLENMIRRKVKFNYRIIAEIITQICGALEYAHDQGIVHRDIKPANIMVLSDYRIKVMDFGIARVDSSSMTRTGIAMGTPNYISPEQLQGKLLDRRSDIFSLGIMMYEMLLHRRPFKGENLTTLIYSIVNNEPEPPSSVDSSIPYLFDRVIEKALKKNPAERYQHASEISTALSDFVESFTSKRTTTV